MYCLYTVDVYLTDLVGSYLLFNIFALKLDKSVIYSYNNLMAAKVYSVKNEIVKLQQPLPKYSWRKYYCYH